MTDERMQEIAREWLVNYDKPLRIRDGEHLGQIVEALAAFGRTVRAETQREAAELMCEHCAAHLPVVKKEKGYIPNFGDFGGGYIHYPVTNSNSCYEACDAASLLAEAEKESQ